MQRPVADPPNEAHLREMSRVMLYVSDARRRTARARELLAKEGAEPHLLAALDQTEEVLRAEHKRLMQGSLFHVPEEDREAVDDQQRFAL